MTRQFAVRGLKPEDARLRFRQRVSGVDQAWTETLALNPGRYSPPPLPERTLEAFSLHTSQYLPVASGGTAERVPDLDAITVHVSRSEGPRPLGVAFWLKSTDPNFHAFVNFGTAKWTFSQHSEEDYTFRSLSDKLAGETAGTAFGPYVGHVYEKGPGTGVATPLEHQWSVTLSYPGLPDRTITHADGATNDLKAAACGAILVHDDDYWFDGTGIASSARKSRYWAPGYTDDPAGIDAFYAVLAAEEVAEAGSSGFYGWDLLTEVQRKSYLRTGGLGVVTAATQRAADPLLESRHRVRIKAGTTATSTNALEHRAGLVNIRLDRFGMGDDPVLDFSSVTIKPLAESSAYHLNPRKGSEICNIKLVGPYDPVAPGKGVKEQYRFCGILNTEGTADSRDMYFYRVDVSGFYFNFGKNSGVWNRSVFADCHSHDWYNYGFWAQGFAKTAIVGCRIAQDPNALMLQRRYRATNGGNYNETIDDPATFTAAFNWSGQGAVANSSTRDPAFPTAVPAGYEIPASGAWGEHPWDVANPATPSPEDVDPNKVAPFAFSWWRRNYWRFTGWTGANNTAFDYGWNEEYEKCALHGPLRHANPSAYAGIHQCEFASYNGWSTSGSHDITLVDPVTGHWDRAQAVDAWYIQECGRIWTSAGGASPGGGLAKEDAGLSMWRCLVLGNGFTLKPATDADIPETSDDVLPHSGIILDGLINDNVDFPLGYRYCALRNSLFYYNLTAVTTVPSCISGVIESRFKAEQPTWLKPDILEQEPTYVYNNTLLVTGSIEAGTAWKFVSPPILDPDDSEQKSGRRLFEWHNARIKAATGPDPADGVSSVTALTATTTLGGTLAAPYAPQAGSTLLAAAAVPLLPRYDLEGRERPESAAVGAFEVS